MLAKASDQPTHASQAHRFREQARSHRGFVLGKGICEHHQSLWERACSRRRRVSQRMRHRLTAFASKLARHRGFVPDVGIREHPQSLWERACSRRRRVSQHMRHRPTAFASMPAPKGDLCWTWELVNTINHCGSGLAREGVGSANACVTGPPLREQARSHRGMRWF